MKGARKIFLRFPSQILDPKLLVSTRVLSANSLSFVSFLLTGTELKYHLTITYE